MNILLKIFFFFYVHYLSGLSSTSIYYNPLPNSNYIVRKHLHSKNDDIRTTEQSNFGKVYNDLKNEQREITQITECDCTRILTRDLESTFPRYCIRDIVDKITCKIISRDQIPTEQKKILFWGSGKLLNELTIIMHLLEKGIYNFDIYIYDLAYMYYDIRDNPKEIMQKLEESSEDALNDLDFTTVEETRESKISQIFDTFIEHNKSVDQFIDYLRKKGFKNPIYIYHKKEHIQEILFHYAFALDAFIQYCEEFIKKHKVKAKFYFLLNKYNDCGVEDKNTATFEVYKVTLENFIAIKTLIFKEQWISENELIINYSRIVHPNLLLQ
jgi:hypothetical protein